MRVLFDLENPTLKARLKSREPVGAFWFSLGSVALVEMAVAAGAEAVVIDMQHGLFDRLTLEAAIGAVPGHIPCLVRVEDHSAAAIGRALDAGAEGLLVPLVETAEQAEEIAAACHYPPKGNRSGGGVRPVTKFDRYLRAAAGAITVGVMIETKRGLDNAEAIAAVDLVDFVFVGTGDLALSLGRGFVTDGGKDEVWDTIKERCAKSDTPCGAFTMTAEGAANLAADGYWMTIVSNDIAAAAGSFGAALKAFGKGRAA